MTKDAEKSSSSARNDLPAKQHTETKTMDSSDHADIDKDELNAAMHYIDFQKPNW